MPTAEELLSECVIRVHGTDFTQGETVVLHNVMGRVASHVPNALSVQVYARPRRENGWLEWEMTVAYKSGGFIHIGIINRGVGLDIEYHS